MTAGMWVTLGVALISGAFGLWSVIAGKQRAKEASPVDDANTVNQMALSLADKMKKDLDAAWEEIRILRERARVLEKEVIRLGGDPNKLNGH